MYSLLIIVQNTFLRFYVFYADNINVEDIVFFLSASWKKRCATHWRERRVWDLVIFDWLSLSMRMQVILDSSFARPGGAPICGGKKGEFRDWTSGSRAVSKNCEILFVSDRWQTFWHESQMPHRVGLVWVKFPTVRSLTWVKCPGIARVGMGGLGIDWYITTSLKDVRAKIFHSIEFF